MTNEVDYRRGYNDGLHEALRIIMDAQTLLMKTVLAATDIFEKAKLEQLRNKQDRASLQSNEIDGA